MGIGSSSPLPDQNHGSWRSESTISGDQRLALSGSSIARKQSYQAPSNALTLGQRDDVEFENGSQAGQTKMTSWEPPSAELSRTISHLAAANQQLAAAHSLALEQFQGLFVELRRKRDKNRAACPNCGSTGKPRPVLYRSTSGAAKPTTRKLRKLKRVPAIDESVQLDDADGERSPTQDLEATLRKEIEELSTFKSELQTKNDELTHDLEQQRSLIERLTQGFKDSQSDCAKKAESLERAREKLSRSELESAGLLAKLETFQCERREEAEERRKHLQALDEVTQQIRALEAAIRGSSPPQPAGAPTPSTSVAASASPAATTAAEEGSEEGTRDATTSSLNEQFKRDLILKREARQRAIAAISSEMERLRRELETERTAHAETAGQLEALKEAQAARAKTDEETASSDKTENKTPEHVEALRLVDLLKISDEVASSLWLQLERTDDLRFQLESEPEEHRQRIGSLRRLAEETRASLRSRRQQTNALKDRLAQLLVRLGEERGQPLRDEDDEIRREADRQLEDIGRSRMLCDERSRILAELKEHCSKQLHELKLKLGSLGKDNQSLEEDLRKTEDKMDAQDAEILNLESQLGLAKADCRDLQNQMSLINSLFTQMLLSASSAEMDLDRLTQLLQENHDLISGMAREKGTEAAALPKLLLDIVEQVDGRVRESEEKKEEGELQEENIAHNLPKVWRVLLELLSCHVAGTGSSAESSAESAPDSCYKSVDTPTGPRLVISVSKTYIRLKELILEKKHLEKEMNRMKQLNTHLESKLSEQEKRLSTVSDELSKTWNIVGRMQAQHQQLHTHEKILRYELQQKRKMLQELKQELEYCREKWESARQKNSNTEIEWRSLRREFAARKALVAHGSAFSNSGESGFSDEREESDEDDREIGKRVRIINSRRRSKKDDSRVISPDTESEQPTDNEFSESKTASSSSTSGQQTPTPEADAELDNPKEEGVEEDTLPVATVPDSIPSPEGEVLNPLDKALTRVIENLLETNEYASADDSSDTDKVESAVVETANHQASAEEKITTINQEAKDSSRSDSSEAELTEAAANPEFDSPAPMSVFSIGPIPTQALEAKNVQFGYNVPITPIGLPREIPESSTRPSSPIPSTSAEVVEEVSKDAGKETSPAATNAEETVERIASGGSEEVERRAVDLSSSEVLDARAARLKSLEEQAQWLVKKVSATNRRGSALNSRLEELHETYGSVPAAPPMPDVLPAVRLQTETESSPECEADSPVQQTNGSDDDVKFSADAP